MSEHAEAVETEATEQDAQQTGPSEAETKARALGWKPEDEYKGDPARWKPADEWLNDGERIMGRKLSEAEKTIAELKGTVKGHDEKYERLARMTAAAMKDREEQIRSEYDTKMRDAVRLGDEEAYDKAESGKAKALERLEAAKSEPEKKKTPDAEPEALAWVDENPWVKTDPRLGRHAARFLDDVIEDMPAADLKTQLAEVKARMIEAYPDKFGVQRSAGNGASRVEGGTRTPGGNGSSGGSLYAKLPKEAKDAVARMIEDGLIKASGDKEIAAARERYAQKYLESA